MSRRPLPPPRTTGAADVLRSRYRTDDDQAADAEAPTASETSAPREVMTSRARRAATPQAPEAVTSARRKPTRSRGREAAGPRRHDVTNSSRSGRPSASAETTVSFTVRFSTDEADAHLQLLMALKRAGRLKRLPDKSEVIRAALQLIEEDPELQQRVLGRL